jgi:hypothetical protein
MERWKQVAVKSGQCIRPLVTSVGLRASPSLANQLSRHLLAGQTGDGQARHAYRRSLEPSPVRRKHDDPVRL